MLFIRAASASVFPPAPAHRSMTLSPGIAPESAAAIWDAQSCTSNHPIPWAGSTSTLMLRVSPPGCSMRTASGESGPAFAPNLANASRTCDRLAFNVLTRRSIGARWASAAPSSATRSPNTSVSEGSSHSGKSPRMCVGRSSRNSRSNAAVSFAVRTPGPNCSVHSVSMSEAFICHTSRSAPSTSARGRPSPMREAAVSRLRKTS